MKAIPLSISATAAPATSAAVLLCGSWCLAGTGAAEDVFTDAQWSQSAGPKASAPSAAPVGSSLMAIGMSLVAVIALAVLLGWLVKRLGVKRLVQSKGRYLEVIESVPLGFKRQVSLVRLGDVVVLVGVGEHELTTLATLPVTSVIRDEPMAPSPSGSPTVAPTSSAPPDSAFRALLTKVLKG